MNRDLGLGRAPRIQTTLTPLIGRVARETLLDRGRWDEIRHRIQLLDATPVEQPRERCGRVLAHADHAGLLHALDQRVDERAELLAAAE